MNDFERYLEELRQKLTALPDIVLQEKELPYGRQFKVLRGDEKTILSVYKGKKGISIVWGGQEGLLMSSAKAVVSPEHFASSEKDFVQHENSGISMLENCAGFRGIWAGSDESGKGDFFGPLVVAAVLVDKDIAQSLLAIGVKDCKTLTDKEVLRQAPLIKKSPAINVVLALKPEMYNFRYEQMKNEKKNLNHLLASGHITALSQVIKQRPECNYALVDQFSANSGIGEALENEFPWLNVVEQKRAEADVAVAAASVLARAKFLEVMDELATIAGRVLPKGGGDLTTNVAREIKAVYGAAFLDKLVKKHFANYKKIN